MGIENNVRFYGWVANPYSFLANSQIYISASLKEAYGNVLIEAMASKCPIIATNCPGGTNELLGNGRYGILTSPFGEKYDLSYRLMEFPTLTLSLEEIEMADKIFMLLSNPIKRKQYINSAFETVGMYDCNTIIKQYQQYIETIIK